uniref:RPA43 OB domain-containing protein n=1 Tax=Attheya septentrionalis TaxID=420275 RepID=A0A7S2UC88_9STRA|mmetsp:Transcript_17779/g.32187  ORF Transcript_17779/g.32187 Transcript_17779/m.32187 type:complete len:261 (+) Transcript_17779:27-809(+)
MTANGEFTKEEHKALKKEKKEAKKAKKESKMAKKEAKKRDRSPTGKGELELANKGTLPSKRAKSENSPGKVHTKEAIRDETGLPSPFTKRQLSLLVSLYPASLGSVSDHICRSIRSLLLKFSDGVDGILLAFDNVKILGREQEGDLGRGRILNEMPQIHYRVLLDALVFCPVVGMKLTGKVNESFPSHIGMLVHAFFNAMVSSDHLRAAGYIFDRDAQHWTSSVDNTAIGIDDQVEFSLDKLHECAGVISLEGCNPSVTR